MRQTLMIDHIETAYTISENAVKSVLGDTYIARPLLYNDALRILYAGLKDKRGYSEEEFISAVRSGVVYARQDKGQVPLASLRAHIKQRITALNANAKTWTLRKEKNLKYYK